MPDESLRRFGFPPRPDAARFPEAYAAWAKGVTAPQRRIQPQLRQTNKFHGPARLRGSSRAPQPNTNSILVESTNWSGYSIYASTDPFRASYLYAYYIVPVAQQAFGACTGSWDYSAQWVGIDGFVSNDVLQAGTEADAYCSGGNKSQYYGAWIEWFPLPETQISNFIVEAGDVMYVEVWNTSATQGNAYMVDFTRGESVALTFNAPSGTALVGDSVEWIVERPEVGNSLATLTNYVACPFEYCFAGNATTGYSPGASPSGTVYALEMVDNNGNDISYPYLLGPTALWFRDWPPAY
ncbi:MAG TPA: G1 family glutamic endopeptidase [Chthoniobacterales bacterium]|nr:G1 family glutamic endopeptidase [Chthoniobacterales bacterium]